MSLADKDKFAHNYNILQFVNCVFSLYNGEATKKSMKWTTLVLVLVFYALKPKIEEFKLSRQGCTFLKLFCNDKDVKK